MSIVFLFGAGASYGNPDCTPHPPPLGSGLFDALCALGGFTAKLPRELAEPFRQNFEGGMQKLVEEQGHQLPAILREMAAYFAQFEPGPTNYYRLIVDEARRSTTDVVFATTNYDLLIETCMMAGGSRVSHSARSRSNGNFLLLKPHGSCNFLPDLEKATISRMEYMRFGLDGPRIEMPMRCATRNEVIRFCGRDDSIAPAIAAYMPGKMIHFCYTILANMQADFVASLANAHKIFVVGLHCNPDDKHLWEPLANAPGELHYVGLESIGYEDWCRRQRMYKSSVFIAKTFEEALPELLHAIRSA